MKKICLIFITVIFSAMLFAQSSKVVGFNINIATGFPVYTDSAISDANDLINDGDFKRIIIGGSVLFSVNVLDPLMFIAGADNLCDFCWDGSEHANHIDYAFLGGIKIYSGVGGLNFSICYTLGQRADFINNSLIDSDISTSSWGNGFRLSAEYDFHYDSSYACMPVLGFYYRFMPRGNDNYDNIISVYAGLAF